MFRYKTNSNTIVIYIDDMLIISYSTASLDKTVALLQDRFKIRDLSELYYYLSIRIIRDRSVRSVYVV